MSAYDSGWARLECESGRLVLGKINLAAGWPSNRLLNVAVERYCACLYQLLDRFTRDDFVHYVGGEAIGDAQFGTVE